MSKKLYAFEWLDWHGVVQGLFIEEESIVNDAIGKELYFGEVLGKHSEVFGILEECDLEILVSDEKEVECLEKYDFIPFGYNPLDYFREECDEDEEELADMWNTRTPEIVRCGECVYWTGDINGVFGTCRLENDLNSNSDAKCGYLWNKDAFCSYGERKEEK